LLEIEFGTKEEMFEGNFILMPDQESYARILSSLGIVI
jgi:hypothetical protein